MTTAELLKTQMEYAALQIEILEAQIGSPSVTIPVGILRRVQDQFRELAASLRIALQVKV